MLSVSEPSQAAPSVSDQSDTLVFVRGLTKWFEVGKGLQLLPSGGKKFVHALDSISFEIRRGEIFGIVGESGCGKTTLGRVLSMLIEPTAGKVYFQGEDIFSAKGETRKALRKKIQIIFQDAHDSLNPKMTILDSVLEAITVNKIAKSTEEESEMARKSLKVVSLPEELFGHYPGVLSGGQLQRVALARSLVLQPSFLVADEPVSMLDVSTRGDVLNLMIDIKNQFGLTLLFITHDIALGRHFCDRIAVMYLGEIVEILPSGSIADGALHPYTLALISAVKIEKEHEGEERQLRYAQGDVPSAITPPSGCRFHTRCQFATDVCMKDSPKLIQVSDQHLVACHHLEEVRAYKSRKE